MSDALDVVTGFVGPRDGGKGCYRMVFASGHSFDLMFSWGRWYATFVKFHGPDSETCVLKTESRERAVQYLTDIYRRERIWR